MAEREGFEPPEPCGSRAFQARAFDHSATSPVLAQTHLKSAERWTKGHETSEPFRGQPTIGWFPEIDTVSINRTRRTPGELPPSAHA